MKLLLWVSFQSYLPPIFLDTFSRDFDTFKVCPNFPALDFQIIGEGVVLVAERGRLSYNDRENYIDFKMRLLGPTSGASGKSNLLRISNQS